ncbi:helix-turn-helix domain-containing protein [Tissierella praeacuta]|uniref:helix-turn-helix domain-containing protein n=1 Tax=Tissierella praeacuta TaxID=43131 RepID=UPI002FD8CAAC
MTKKRRNVTYKDWITEEGLIKIEGWARDGLVNEQIADEIGIHPSTLYDWQKKYPEIAEVLKRGKDVIDRKVENALLKRALGYKYEEITYEKTEVMGIDEVGNMDMIPGTKIKTVIKEVIPDTTAQIFWLKNRKPEQWRDKRDIDVKGNMEINNPYEGLTKEQLLKLASDEE